jgi:hypothetical protein
MKDIGIALFYFYESYNRYPAGGLDENGKPNGLSWRVHLLPFIEQEEQTRLCRFRHRRCPLFACPSCLSRCRFRVSRLHSWSNLASPYCQEF